VILLYDKPFWDDERDMFGLLNEANRRNSLDMEDYARSRGRFYLIWNASKISGRPALVALMAGNAAHDAEQTDSSTLLAEINERLGKVFAPKIVTSPSEVIVTRWKRDPFTRGTYSYVGPRTRAGDYDLMAQSVGNLHFAGEATCGTHPATVHGAFLSGLRVAADVVESMAGPISLPTPLVGAAPVKKETMIRNTVAMAHSLPIPSNATSSGEAVTRHAPMPIPAQAGEPVIKQELETVPLSNIPVFTQKPVALPKKFAGPPRKSVCAGDESFWAQPTFDSGDLDYEANIAAAILSQIGERPVKPLRPGVNPFLLFTKSKWDECKDYCSRNNTLAGRNDIRTTLGKWWKAASAEDKQPYLEQSEAAQQLADAQRHEWNTKVEQYDKDARRIRQEYVRDNPAPQSQGNSFAASKRKSNNSSSIVLDHV
jgi:hypothetical protein